jgi:hypothetical protein
VRAAYSRPTTSLDTPYRTPLNNKKPRVVLVHGVLGGAPHAHLIAYTITYFTFLIEGNHNNLNGVIILRQIVKFIEIDVLFTEFESFFISV